MTETPQDASRDALAELCRQAAFLRGIGPDQARRVRISSGDVSLEVEWPEPAAPEPGGRDRETTPESLDDGAEHDEHHVCAPMVGTYYAAPEPGAAPFVREGDTVVAGQQVGIVEAMKLMNAVEADRSGRVRKILLPDATPVEYGQPIIVLAPA